MDTTDEEDENGDGASSCHHLKTRERDSLEDLRVWCRKSAVLFTVIVVALIASSMRDESWKRSRLEWVTYLSKMPENHFFTLFRMDYRTFRMDYRTLQHVEERTKHGMQRDYLQSELAGGYMWRKGRSMSCNVITSKVSAQAALFCDIHFLVPCDICDTRSWYTIVFHFSVSFKNNPAIRLALK